LVAEVSLMEGDAWQLVALTDVEHRNRITPIQKLLDQVSTQETRAPDHRTPFIALNDKHHSVIKGSSRSAQSITFKLTGRTRVAILH